MAYIADRLTPDGLDDDDASPCEVVTVGWLVSESESAVVLTLSISSENDARGAFCIPRACITRMASLVQQGVESGVPGAALTAPALGPT